MVGHTIPIIDFPWENNQEENCFEKYPLDTIFGNGRYSTEKQKSQWEGMKTYFSALVNRLWFKWVWGFDIFPTPFTFKFGNYKMRNDKQ